MSKKNLPLNVGVWIFSLIYSRANFLPGVVADGLLLREACTSSGLIQSALLIGGNTGTTSSIREHARDAARFVSQPGRVAIFCLSGHGASGSRVSTADESIVGTDLKLLDDDVITSTLLDASTMSKQSAVVVLVDTCYSEDMIERVESFPAPVLVLPASPHNEPAYDTPAGGVYTQTILSAFHASRAKDPSLDFASFLIGLPTHPGFDKANTSDNLWQVTNYRSSPSFDAFRKNWFNQK